MTGKKVNANVLTEDEIVDRVVLDPNQKANVRLLKGFLGKSSRKGYWRLYRTLSFDEYLEFSIEDVVSHAKVKFGGTEFTGTMVWIKRDAELTIITTTKKRSQENFFRGSITTDLYQSAAIPRGFRGHSGSTGREWRETFPVLQCIVEHYTPFITSAYDAWNPAGYCDFIWAPQVTWEAEC